MGKDLANTDHCLLFCNGGSCKRKGSEEMIREVRAHLRMEGMSDRIHTIKTLCMGHCDEAPYVCVLPENVWYKEVSVEQGIRVVEEHLKEGKHLEDRLLFRSDMNEMATEVPEKGPNVEPFFLQEGKREGELLLQAKGHFKEGDLYPMLKTALEKHADQEVEVPEQDLKEHCAGGKEVRFDGRSATIELQGSECELLLGPPPKEASQAVQDRRIRTVLAESRPGSELPPTFHFRNRRGKTELSIRDRTRDASLWDHFVRHYFEQDPDPKAHARKGEGGANDESPNG